MKAPTAAAQVRPKPVSLDHGVQQRRDARGDRDRQQRAPRGVAGEREGGSRHRGTHDRDDQVVAQVAPGHELAEVDAEHVGHRRPPLTPAMMPAVASSASITRAPLVT